MIDFLSGALRTAMRLAAHGKHKAAAEAMKEHVAEVKAAQEGAKPKDGGDDGGGSPAA